jgi:hypothetical protein
MAEPMTQGMADGSRRIPAAPDRPAGAVSRPGFRHALCWALAAVIPAVGAYANEWTAEGSASLTGTFDDNIRLSATNSQSVFGAIFAPYLAVHGRSPLWDMKFMADLSISQYTEDSNLNSEDPRLRLDARYKTQLGLLRLEGEASRASTLVTEVADTGNFTTTTQRNLIRLAPSWSYSVTELDTISIGAGWTEVDYESNALNDYRSFNAYTAWARQVTQADVVSLSLSGSHFISDSVVELQSSSVTAQVIWDHAFSDRLSTSVAAGPQYYMTDVLVPGGGLMTDEESAVGYSANASVDYQLSELTSVGASIGHKIEPTSSGSPLQRTRLEISARHQFQPRLSGSVRAFVQQDSNPTDDSAASRDRNYFSIEPRLTWEVAEDWDLTGAYRFRTQDTATADRAFSNAIFVTVSYHPESWTFGH